MHRLEMLADNLESAAWQQMMDIGDAAVLGGAL